MHATPTDERLSLESTLYFWGKAYTVSHLSEGGRQEVVYCNKRRIELYTPEGSPTALKETLLQAWLQHHFEHRVPAVIGRWQPVLTFHLDGWQTEALPHAWSALQREPNILTVHPKLVHKRWDCLELIILRRLLELAGTVEEHSVAQALSRHMPDWRQASDLLAQLPEAHPEWDWGTVSGSEDNVT